MTGTRFEDHQVKFYVIQGEEEWYDGYDYSDDHGRVSENVSFDEDLLPWQFAVIEARDSSGNVLATAMTLVVDEIPEFSDIFMPSFASAPILVVGAAQNGGSGSLDYQQIAKTMGELEGESLAERSIRAITSSDTIARTGLTYYDEGRGVDVYAPSSKYFVEYSNGAVELRDIPSGLPSGQDHPYVSEITSITRGAPSLGQVSKEVVRTGMSFFDSARGIDVYAADGKFFIEYADGSIEERTLPTGGFIPRPEDFMTGGTDNSQSKSAFGPTAEDLGLLDSVTSAPKPSSELMLIGESYISSSGVMRVAGPGLVFLQDPVTKTILLRPESEASSAMQAPASVIAEQQAATALIAGTSITAQEQEYLETLRKELVAEGYRFSVEDLWAITGDSLDAVIGIADATITGLTAAQILDNVDQAQSLLSPSRYDYLVHKIQNLDLNSLSETMSEASKSSRLLSIARPVLKAIDAIETLFILDDAISAYGTGGWTDAGAVTSASLLKLGTGVALVGTAGFACTAGAPFCIALAGATAVGYELSFLTEPGQALTQQTVDWFDQKFDWVEALFADLF